MSFDDVHTCMQESHTLGLATSRPNGNSPCLIFHSAGFTPAHTTLTSTSPLPRAGGLGKSVSRDSTDGGPQRRITTARMPAAGADEGGSAAAGGASVAAASLELMVSLTGFCC